MTPPINVCHVVDAAGLEKVTSFFSRCPEFCLDIETNMTDGFWDRRIRTIQVGNRQEQYVIDMLPFAGSSDDLMSGMGNYHPSAWTKPVVDCIRPFLESPRYIKVGHNLAFEYETLKWNLGLRICGLYDTELAEKVLYAGAVSYFERGFWGLGDLVARYCGLEISKSEQTRFDLHSPLTSEQLEYAGLDVRFPLAIKGAQTTRIVPHGLQKVVQIENDAIPAFSDMHLNGLLIDAGKWTGLIEKTRGTHKNNIDRLDEVFIPIVGEGRVPYREEDLHVLECRWRDCKDSAQRALYLKEFRAARKENASYIKKSEKFEGKANVQYGSPSQLLSALRKGGYRLANTNDLTLELLEGDKVIDAVREYRTTEKVLNGYGAWLEKYIDKNTGRVHSNINQLGADTGRTTSSGPNVQNINREADWRECFVARRGYVIITVDYNGCELRILAETSQEKVWVDAFNAGWDVHSVGAEIIFGERWKNDACLGGEKIVKKGKEIALPPCAYYSGNHQKCDCPGHKLLRDQIKAINFGIAYGMEAGKLARGLRISRKEAQTLLDTYRKAFPCVTKWLETIGKEAQMNLMSRTLSGRYRLYEKPTWEKAKEVAKARAEKDKKPFTSDSINRTYQGMYGGIGREGKNSPIQGTNADMLKLAVGAADGYMWRELESTYGAYLVNVVHDEIVVEAREENAQEVFEFIGRCMKKAGAEFLKTVTAEYEGKIKPFWSK